MKKSYPTWLQWATVLLVPAFPLVLVGVLAFLACWVMYSMIAGLISAIFGLGGSAWAIPTFSPGDEQKMCPPRPIPPAPAPPARWGGGA